jgi:hypothetical protein
MQDEPFNDFSEFLGKLDAQYDVRPDLFIDPGYLDKIKWGEKENGKCVIVGAKGTGKTAILQYVEANSKDSIIWKIDQRNPELSTNVTEIGEYPLEFDAIIRTLVFEKLLTIVKENKEIYGKEASEAIKELDPLIDNFKEHFQSFIKIFNGIGPVKFDFDKIIESKSKSKFTGFNFKRYIQPLRRCFSIKPVLILFDDIDDIFLGSKDSNYRVFIEGLIRAARTINLDFDDKVHFLVFLKYGVYRSFYEYPSDYDKVKDYILEIHWNNDSLEEMISRRIEDKVDVDDKSENWKKWGLVFRPKDKNGIKEIQEYLFDRCPSGPRDLIDFINRAIDKKKKLNINLEDIKSCETSFSEDKIIAIHEDYGNTYPEIQNLLKRCFSSTDTRQIKTNYSFSDFENYLFEIKTDPDIMNTFDEFDYFIMSGIYGLFRILYTIGFIGYKINDNEKWIYVLDEPKGDNLRDSKYIQIHKAYWKALSLS